GTAFGAVAFISTLGMALGPWAGGWLYDAFGSYFWLFLGSFGIGLGAIAIAFTFRPPDELVPVLPPSASAATSAWRSATGPRSRRRVCSRRVRHPRIRRDP